MFRKFMFDRISRYGDVFAILFTSVAFGIFHGNLYQFIYTSAVGVVIAYSYAISRRIIYPILIHMILNLYASLPLMLSGIFGQVSSSGDLTELAPSEALAVVGDMLVNILYTMLTLGFIGGAIAILIVSLVKRRVEIPKNGEVRLSGMGLARAVILNVGCILLVICGLYEFTVYYMPTDPLFEVLVGLLQGTVG